MSSVRRVRCCGVKCVKSRMCEVISVLCVLSAGGAKC